MTISRALQIAAISICFSHVVEAETTNAQAIDLNNQAVKYIHAQRWNDAEKALLRALRHWGTLASVDAAAAHNNLAQVYKMKYQYAAADPHYRTAIEMWETVEGPAQPNVGKGLMNLADLYRVQGKLAGSAKMLERAIAIFDASSAPSLDARNRLLDVYFALGRSVEARRLQRGHIDVSLLQSNLR